MSAAERNGKSEKKSHVGGPFIGKDDPRNGRGPAPGAPNAGRPPDAFKAKMAELASRPDILKQLEVYLASPDCPDTFLKAWKECADRGFGKAVQRQELTGAEGGPIETTNSPREALTRELDRIATRLGTTSPP